MKVLIVGGNHPLAIETKYHHSINALGFPCDLLDVRSMLTTRLNKSIVNKVLFRIFPVEFCKPIGEKLIQFLKGKSYTHVFVFKGIEVPASTIKQIRELGLKTINYNPDHPIIKSSPYSQNQNTRDSIEHYNLHLCYSQELVTLIRRDFGLKAEWLPFGYDLDGYDFSNFHETEFATDSICFIGNPDVNRARLIRILGENKIPVVVYGDNWGNYLKTSPYIRVHSRVDGKQFWSTMQKHVFQLNLFRKHNVNSHNMRTFEIPAVGSIQIAPRTAEHMYLFNEKESIFLFSNTDELIYTIRDLLTWENAKVNELRLSILDEVFQSRFTYHDRAKQALDYIKTL